MFIPSILAVQVRLQDDDSQLEETSEELCSVAPNLQRGIGALVEGSSVKRHLDRVYLKSARRTTQPNPFVPIAKRKRRIGEEQDRNCHAGQLISGKSPTSVNLGTEPR